MLGGISGQHRDLMDDGLYGEFEQTLQRVLGARVRADESSARDLWGSLANVTWIKKVNDKGVTEGVIAQLEDADLSVSYSFRAAGDLVAALVGEGDYLNYYCCAPEGYVRSWIAELMEQEGWTYDAD